MNGKERLTLEDMNRKLTEHIKTSETLWKDITPIVNSYNDRQVVEKFLDKVWRGLVAILSLIALIGGIWAIFFRK